MASLRRTFRVGTWYIANEIFKQYHISCAPSRFTISPPPMSTSLRSVTALCSAASLLILLSACASTGINVNTDGSMDIQTDEGTTTVGGERMPEDWPEDAPAYPGATVSYAASVNPATGKPGMAVLLMTADAAATVNEYYTKELASQGWTIGATIQGGGTSIISATKDDRTMSLAIAKVENQTSITIGIEKSGQK